MLVSVVEPVDAMVPAVPLVGALTKEVVVMGLLASWNMISFVNNADSIIDDLVPFLSLEDCSYGVYGDGKLAVSVPNQDFLYNWLMNKLGYGTGFLYTGDSNFCGAVGSQWADYFDSSYYNSEPVGYKDFSGFTVNENTYILGIYNAEHGYTKILKQNVKPFIDTFGINPTYGRYITIKSTFRTFGINENNPTAWRNDMDGSRLVRPDLGDRIYFSNYALEFPDGFLSANISGVDISDVWDPQYNTPTGINYNTWVAQPSGKYFIDIPVIKNELGEVVVDDVALSQQTTDIARVDEYVTEYNDDKQVIPVTPYDPTVPVTYPVTDPITDVQSDTWMDRLLSKFVNLFILPDGYFTDRFNELRNSVPMLAFPLQIINDIESISKLGPFVLDDIRVTAWGGTHTIVSFQGLRDSLPTVHNWVRGVIFILLLFYNYDQVYKLIRGNPYGFVAHVADTAGPRLAEPSSGFFNTLHNLHGGGRKK